MLQQLQLLLLCRSRIVITKCYENDLKSFARCFVWHGWWLIQFLGEKQSHGDSGMSLCLFDSFCDSCLLSKQNGLNKTVC
mgnify:CR=1 FL=1